MANIDRESQEELARQAAELANGAHSNHRYGEAQIIHSNALLIKSNARVEGQIKNLINQLKISGRKADSQTAKLLKLTWSLAGLTASLVILTVALLIKSN